MKTLWIIGAGPESCPAIERGLALGHRVVASDRNPGAPGLRLAHHGVVASVYDPEETLEAAKAFARDHGRVDGVLCVAADAPATAARLAGEFGLRGVDATSAHLATDKLAMKERFAADGVPVPWFSAVRDARHLAELVRRHEPPLVIKPVDSRGARGVIRLLDGSDPTWAFEAARRHSPSGRVLLERFVAGPQLSTESLVIDGRCHTPGLADRNYEHLERFHPFVIEDGGDLPTALPPAIVERVRDTVARAAESLGVRDGVVKGDVVVEEGRPVVIELAARLSGGYFCSHHIPLSTGVDLIGAAIRVALGLPVDPAELVPGRATGVSQRFLFPEPGRVVAVEGVEAVAARPEIALCEIRVQPGAEIGEVENHPARAGLVIATAATRAEATARARAAVAAIRIRTEPVLDRARRAAGGAPA